MARAPFSVFKRDSRDRATKKAVVRYVARFFDEDGNVVRTKTLEATSSTKATLEAKGLLDKGEGVALEDRFGLREDEGAPGRPLSVRYVEVNGLIVKKHLGESLKGIRLHSLTVPRMERIVLDLSAAGVNPRTINCLIQCVRVPVTDFSRRHRVPDPLQYLGRVAERPRVRGTLSIDEIAKIIELRDESHPRIAPIVHPHLQPRSTGGEFIGMHIHPFSSARSTLTALMALNQRGPCSRRRHQY